MNSISRRQLMGFGSTQFMAKALTQELKPVGKQNRSNLYKIIDIIQVIKVRLDIPRIRKVTKVMLQKLLAILQELSSNVVAYPFGEPESENAEAVVSLINSLANPKIAKHRIKAAEIRAKEGSYV